MTSSSRLPASRLAAAGPAAARVGRAERPTTADFATLVRGYGFAARPPGSPGPQVGDRALLAREPANPRDPLAVAVWLAADEPWRIGYLDRTVAARLAPRLDAGQTFAVELAGWVEVPDTDRHRPLVRVRTAGPHLEHRPEPSPGGGTATPLWQRPPRSTRRTVTPGR